jgi:hypothetical protein
MDSISTGKKFPRFVPASVKKPALTGSKTIPMFRHPSTKSTTTNTPSKWSLEHGLLTSHDLLFHIKKTERDDIDANVYDAGKRRFYKWLHHDNVSTSRVSHTNSTRNVF